MLFEIDKHNENQIALNDGRNVVSYGELCSSVKEICSRIPSRCLIFILASNTASSVATYISTIEADSVPVILEHTIDFDMLNGLIEKYLPQYIWCPQSMKDGLAYHEEYSWQGYSLLSTGQQRTPLHELLELCMPTSGSTGSPKFVRYKKGNIEYNARAVAEAFGWTAEERSICSLPMGYTMGLNIINSHLSVGATCLLTEYNLLTPDFWEFIKREKGTNFCGVPFSYDLLHKLGFERMELPYLKTITEGGGKLTDTMFRELAEYAKRTGRRFIASYGTTETAARLAVLPAEDALKKIGSIGLPMRGGRISLLDDNGEEITAQEGTGELCYSGPNVTFGYAYSWEDLAQGDEFHGVYRTGDIARRDADGYYYITGRKSRFLKILGRRISLDQCEKMVSERFNLPCACLGVDDSLKIYIEDPAFAERVRAYISDKIGLYKASVEVIAREIPRNANGKIAYKELLTDKGNE